MQVKKSWINALRASSIQNEQGFTLPIVVGMGLIMVLVATTMILRSQGDQVTASAQKATADSLGVSEVGMARVQSLLKRFPQMAKKSKSEWADEYNRLTSINSCLSSADYSSLITDINKWINVKNSDLQQGEFKILDYSYDGTKGNLKVAGRARSENGSATTSIDNATTSLAVEVPVETIDNLKVPGLWAKTFDMGNNDVSGNILVSGCSVPSGVSAANIVSGTGSLAANPSVEYPALPDLPAAVCPSATATTPCYQVFKQSTTYDPAATTADAITNAYVKANGTEIKECLKDDAGFVVKENNQGELVRVEVRRNSYITNCTDPSHYNTSEAVAFPRPNDKPGSDGSYRYLIGKDGSDSIQLKGGNRIQITAGRKVVFYLQGNVSMSGQSKIAHTGTPPTNFQIYGSDAGTRYRRAGEAPTTTTSISLSGNSTANMFIYAPEATVGVNGGGNATSTITGSVWAKSWDGSSANQLVITQSAAWNNLPLEPPKRISPIQSWQRVQY